MDECSWHSEGDGRRGEDDIAEKLERGRRMRRRGAAMMIQTRRNRNLLKTCLYRNMLSANNCLPPFTSTLVWRLVKCGRTTREWTRLVLRITGRKFESVYCLFVSFKVVRHSRALPCTRERSARRWCCRRSRTLSPPRWRRSRSCRRRPRGSSPAGSPRSRPTQQRRDLSTTETTDKHSVAQWGSAFVAYGLTMQYVLSAGGGGKEKKSLESRVSESGESRGNRMLCVIALRCLIRTTLHRLRGDQKTRAILIVRSVQEKKTKKLQQRPADAVLMCKCCCR